MEILMAALSGISVYLIVVAIFYKSGERKDAIRRRLNVVSSSEISSDTFAEDIDQPIMERLIRPALRALVDKLARRNRRMDALSSHQVSRLKKMLNQAGLTITIEEYSVIRTLVLLGTTASFALFAVIMRLSPMFILLLGLGGLYISYVVMRFHLTSTIRKRKQSMEKQLPDMIDLLSVSVEAGLGFEQAMHHIILNMEGPLIDELAVTYREMSMGRPRRDALALYGERCDNEDVKAFTGAIIQSTQLGIPMKSILNTQAAAIRQARKTKLQEKAHKLSVKILIPMLLFIFPVIFIVLLGPALVNILTTLKG